jgi:hypothetical protein
MLYRRRNFMLRKACIIVFCAALTAMGQTTPNDTSNRTLLAKARKIFVESHTHFVKKEEVEKGLLKRKELEEWGIQVTSNRLDADLVLTLKRAAFQNNFPYTLTDRATGTVVFGGEVNSLGGTVPGKIAAALAKKIKELRTAKPAPEPTTTSQSQGPGQAM